MSKELLKRLKMIYEEEAVEADVFGRRKATPAEIEKALGKKLTEADYPPTNQDIRDKGDD